MNRHKQRSRAADDGRRTLADAMRGADMFIGLSVAGTVTPEMLKTHGRASRSSSRSPTPIRRSATPKRVAARPDAIVATGRSDYPNQVNNVLGFPYIFRGALDCRATAVSEAMKLAAAHALAQLTREPVPDAVISAYGGKSLRDGAGVLHPEAVRSARRCGGSRPPSRRRRWNRASRGSSSIPRSTASALMSKGSNAAYSIMRTIGRTRARSRSGSRSHTRRTRVCCARSSRSAKRASRRRSSSARQAEIEQLCSEMSLDLLSRGAEIVDPRTTQPQSYVDRFYELRQRKGVTAFAAQALLQKSDYFAAIMVDRGDADGCVDGLRLNYPDTVKPMLEIFGLLPQCTVAVGMYMMVVQNQVKFFGDTVFNIDPDAETLANITLQMADAVQGFGVVPRVAMHLVLELRHGPQRRREEDPARARDGPQRAPGPRDRWGNAARDGARPGAPPPVLPVLTFDPVGEYAGVPYLDPANASYQVLKELGGGSAVGPILLGLGKPCAALQNDASVEDIVNMTAYVVLKAQQLRRDQVRA